MPRSKTLKSTTAKPPYKVRSAGTKRGIPLYSSEDSTPVPAQANSTTEEQPEELEVKISRLQSVEKDVPDKVGDELLPKAPSDGDAGVNAAEPTPRGKEPLQKAKTVPVRATERGSGQSQLKQDYEFTTTCECDCDDGWVYDEREKKWIDEEIEARAAEAGMLTEDWKVAKEHGGNDWYPYELACDGMSNDDADAKTQIFRRYRQ